MHTDILKLLSDAYDSKVPFALITVVAADGSSPQRPGAKMIVRLDGIQAGTVGGGNWEYELVKAAGEMLRERVQQRLIEFSLGNDLNMACGGRMAAFIEVFNLIEPVVIFGAGHVARAVAPLLVQVGFHVTVVDVRPEWAEKSAFPDSCKVVVEDMHRFSAEMSSDSSTTILVMTRGHEHDYALFEHWAMRECGFLGVLASRTKVARFSEKLRASGVAAPLCRRIEMPVGLAIGSKTPEEIAVSIAAQLIENRRVPR